MSISGSPEAGGQTFIDQVVRRRFTLFYSNLVSEVIIDNHRYSLSNQDPSILRGYFRRGCLAYLNGENLITIIPPDTNPYHFYAEEAGWRTMSDISTYQGT